MSSHPLTFLGLCQGQFVHLGHFRPSLLSTLLTVLRWQPTLVAMAWWVRLASLSLIIFSRLVRVIRLVSIFASTSGDSYLDFKLIALKRTKMHMSAHACQYVTI